MQPGGKREQGQRIPDKGAEYVLRPWKGERTAESLFFYSKYVIINDVWNRKIRESEADQNGRKRYDDLVWARVL